jgi:hypothetical protein
MHPLAPISNSRQPSDWRSQMVKRIVLRSSAAHQPSFRRRITEPPHSSSAVGLNGTSSSAPLSHAVEITGVRRFLGAPVNPALSFA